MSYDVTYMWNREKQNKGTQKEKKHMQGTNRVLPEGRGGGTHTDEGEWEVQASGYGMRRSWDERDSTGSTVNGIGIVAWGQTGATFAENTA